MIMLNLVSLPVIPSLFNLQNCFPSPFNEIFTRWRIFCHCWKGKFENTVVELYVCTTLYFKPMCIPAPVCTCMCGVCADMCIQNKGQKWSTSFITSIHLIFYWTWISVWATLAGQKASRVSCSCLPNKGYRQALWHLTVIYGLWRVRLRSSCLWSTHSNHWAIPSLLYFTFELININWLILFSIALLLDFGLTEKEALIFTFPE